MKNIRYKIIFPDGKNNEYSIDIDLQNGLLNVPEGYIPDDWAKLEFRKCEHCTLSQEDDLYCPLARSVAYYGLHDIQSPSYEQVEGLVQIEDRILTISTTLQRVLKSLYGLVCSLSNCPYTRFLSPMGVFHAPFANEKETMVRILSFHLLECHIRELEDRSEIIESLQENYRNLEKVNLHFSSRLRGSTQSDAALNAMVLLNFFAQYTANDISYFIDDIKVNFRILT